MDDINRTEAGNEETGRRENNSWVKRHFNYECYMTFLNGCYSCKWEAQQKKKPRRPLCCCSLVQSDGKEMGHIFLDMGNVGLERSAIIVCVSVSVCLCRQPCIMCNGSKIAIYKVKGDQNWIGKEKKMEKEVVSEEESKRLE